ncbi:MAG: pyruvate kinase [Bacteroidales bacterium]|nr:pyruvate kinase [Bacteroidales bacterium]
MLKALSSGRFNKLAMTIHETSKTKIIATLGPASSEEKHLMGLIYSGIDLFRFNFSHGSHDVHEEMIQRVRAINKKMNTHIALLADLQGPKIRLGEVEEGTLVRDDDTIIFTNRKCIGNHQRVYVSYPELPVDVAKGDILLIDDGRLKFKVESSNGEDELVARIIHGGPLYSRKGVNMPHTRLSASGLTDKDKRDLEFIMEHDFDWIALSFVRWAKDITNLKEILQKRNKKALVIAKIEKPEALNELDEIIEAADAVMVARGDLGVEVSFEKVPLIQKQIVGKCIHRSTPVIIATQMLESMITNFRPTRAEANDVANAVFDGVDTVMLSGETSVGKFPVETIQSMQQIIDYAEGTAFVHKHEHIPIDSSHTYIPDSICYNACRMADQSGAKAIIAFAAKPQTAFRLAGNRPNAPVYIFTPDEQIIRQLSLVWGVRTFHIEAMKDVDSALDYAVNTLKKLNLVKHGDRLVQVSSLPLFDFEGVNTIKLTHVL